MCALVSDLESKMKAVREILMERFPWLLIIPCGSNCMNLLHGDIAKHPDVAGALEFCKAMKQFWKQHSFSKAVLERCQREEYDATVQFQRPCITRWSSWVLPQRSCSKHKALRRRLSSTLPSKPYVSQLGHCRAAQGRRGRYPRCQGRKGLGGAC